MECEPPGDIAVDCKRFLLLIFMACVGTQTRTTALATATSCWTGRPRSARL
jgi:hypothetical protein